MQTETEVYIPAVRDRVSLKSHPGQVLTVTEVSGGWVHFTYGAGFTSSCQLAHLPALLKKVISHG